MNDYEILILIGFVGSLGVACYAFITDTIKNRRIK